MFCPTCGREIPDGTTVCLACGATIGDRPVPGYEGSAGRSVRVKPEKKSEILAFFLSFIVPGLGHMYLGRINIGVILLVASIACVVLGSLLHPISYVLCAFLWQFGLFCSFFMARKYNQHLIDHAEPLW